MTTTTIAIYIPMKIQVEILDVFECGEIDLAVIKALSGKPFVDGAKTTTQTAFRTVQVDELAECTCTPRDVMACSACRQYVHGQYGDGIPF